METMPTAAELIEAAIHALRTELLPALQGREAFQARVVANVLDIARRELQHGPAADADERARLEPLTGAMITGPAELPALRRALCDAIRDGRADATTPGLVDHLWADVLARMAIEQPAYPSFVRETRGERPDERP
jgi:hypothetical protein